jgi:hypothetical protein
MVLWEMLTGKQPWEDETFDDIRDKVVVEKERPEIPSNCPRMLEGLIKGCWDDSTLLMHLWF